MARILIEPENAKAILNREDSLEKTLKSLEHEIGGVQRSLRYRISGQEQISARLNDVRDQLAWEATATRSMRDGLDQIVAWYERTEKGDRDRLTAGKSAVQEGGNTSSVKTIAEMLQQWQPPKTLPQQGTNNWINLLMPIVVFPGLPSLVPIPSSILKWLAQDDNAFDSAIFSWNSDDKRREEKTEYISDAELDLVDDLKDSNGKMKTLDGWEDAHQSKASAKYYIDGTTGEITEVDPNDPDAVKEFSEHNKGTIPVDIRLAGVGTSGSIKKWGSDGEIAGKAGGVSGEWGVGVAEYNADAYIGALGVGVMAGAGICAFSAEGKAYLGDEETQIYAKGGVAVGRAEAEASASLGLIDKEGNFNPSAYAGGSVEVIGGEISGAVGGKIAGTDVALKGSLNYGVGAHANIGVHDGKISADLGASLGVGVSVKVEIDVSGTVKAVGEAAGNVVSFVKNLF